MPKITIREKDLTKGYAPYRASSAVLVAGFAKPDEWALAEADKLIDDAGVIELDNQADFVKYVGKVKPSLDGNGETLETEREFASAEGVSIAGQTIFGMSIKPSDPEWEDVAQLGNIYQFVEITDADTLALIKEPRNLLGHLILCGYKIIPDSDPVAYESELSYFQLTPAEAESFPTTDTNDYVIVAEGNEGLDYAENDCSYGNQMTFELLGLGYTVLYKKIQSTADLARADFWADLKDKAAYDFRFAVNGLLTGNREANQVLADFVAERGDATAVLDVDGRVYTSATAKVGGQAGIVKAIITEVNSYVLNSGRYAALFAPSVCYAAVSDEEYENLRFPAGFHYLACFAEAKNNNYAEWYAAAGYNRGYSKYTIDSADAKLGELATNELGPRQVVNISDIKRAVNVITKMRTGYYLWGNRTAETLPDASAKDNELKARHFLNIRQLCTTLKKEIYVACRRFTFDPNSDLLWINFCNTISPTAESMKANQGIEDYRFQKVATTKKATLKARVRIIPIEAVEDFDITLSLEDEFGDTSVELLEDDE